MNVFNIGTLNVLSSKAKKLSLKKDIDRFSLDVYYIRETKIKKGTDINLNKNRLICFFLESQHYGNDFFHIQEIKFGCTLVISEK